ncbi:hypothetical protein FOZ60_002444 [Perkinsus olseni]|uniref:Uncharacterized protein n=1 Tax=Perkinsus olseni TaxID=32597 RepID=A0A7J6NY96_PEROL|nr:hypothetical protein FOZ60_002444 [Perkinsus olseni]
MRPITCIPDQLKLHPVAIGHPLFGDYYYTNDRNTICELSFPQHTDDAGDSAQWIVRWPSRSTPALPDLQPPPESLEEVVMEDEIGSIVGIPPLKPYESALRHLADIESLVRHWGFIEGDDVQLGENQGSKASHHSSSIPV